MAAEADVNTPCVDWVDMEERWALPVALYGGTKVMRDKKTTYLPQYDLETDATYKTRRTTAVLYNALKTTIHVLAGEPLKKPITIDGASDRDMEIAEDMDLADRDIQQFTMDLLVDLLLFGKCHFYPTYPNTDLIKAETGRETLTLRDVRDYQLRPYFIRVPVPDLIGWRGARRGGQEVLDRMRVRELDVEATGQWGEQRVGYVRVYYPDHIERWHEPESNSDEWYLVEEAPNPLGQVPLVTAYARRMGLCKAYPPFEDLAYVNCQHWQNSSDQNNILRFARSYLLAFFGWDEEEIKTVEVGNASGIAQRNTDAHIDVIEHSGHSIDAGRQQLEDLEEQMRTMGADMLMPPTGNETATARAIDRAENMSKLQIIVRGLEHALEVGFEMAAQLDGRELSPDFSISINQEFTPYAMAENPLAAMQQDLSMGLITPERYLNERKRYGLYGDDMDVEEELRLAAEGSPFALGTGSADTEPESQFERDEPEPPEDDAV